MLHFYTIVSFNCLIESSIALFTFLLNTFTCNVPNSYFSSTSSSPCQSAAAMQPPPSSRYRDCEIGLTMESSPGIILRFDASGW